MYKLLDTHTHTHKDCELLHGTPDLSTEKEPHDNTTSTVLITTKIWS